MLNGYVCQVGCQTVVFNDKRTMLSELDQYCDRPEEVEKRFLERAVNRPDGPQCQPDGQRCQGEVTAPVNPGSQLGVGRDPRPLAETGRTYSPAAAGR